MSIQGSSNHHSCRTFRQSISIQDPFYFMKIERVWRLIFPFLCGAFFFYTIPFIWMKTESLICPIYFSDIFYLHIIPQSVLGYLGNTVQIQKELLQICTIFNCIFTSLGLIYLLQIAAKWAPRTK